MRHKRRLRAYKPDEVADAEAVVAFYEQRLEEAYEKLGLAVEAAQKKTAPAAGGGMREPR